MTKKRISLAAIKVLGNMGGAVFSASAIAKEAGIAKSSVFHYFKSIDEVVIDAFTLLVNETYRKDYSNSVSLEDLLERLGHATLDACKNNELFLRAFFEFCMKSFYSDELRVYIKKSHDNFAKELSLVICRHGSKKKNANEYSNLLTSALDGLVLNYLLFKKEKEFEKKWKLLSKSILETYNKEKL